MRSELDQEAACAPRSIDRLGDFQRLDGVLAFTTAVKTTDYFETICQRPDRVVILDEWILRAVAYPVAQYIQSDGRIRRWAPISEMNNRILRVVLLQDGETVHNAFFDRRFKP